MGFGEGGVAVARVSASAHGAGVAGRPDSGDDVVPHCDGRHPTASGDGTGPVVVEHPG